MKRIRRDRTVQRELKRRRWREVRDLKHKWMMKQRERRERRRMPAISHKTAMSKADTTGALAAVVATSTTVMECWCCDQEDIGRGTHAWNDMSTWH